MAPTHPHLDEYEHTVATAQDEATEAAALAAALEERVKDGDESVTPAELENARQLKGFAKLRQEAAARKAERAREAERQRLLAELRTEIESASPTSRAELAKLLKVAEGAVLAFVAACNERNTTVQSWQHRMIALGVPTLNAPQPPAEHQHMAHAGDVLFVGEYPPKRFGQVSPGGYVDQLCSQARFGVALKPVTYEAIAKEA